MDNTGKQPPLGSTCNKATHQCQTSEFINIIVPSPDSPLLFNAIPLAFPMVPLGELGGNKTAIWIVEILREKHFRKPEL